MFTYAGKAQGVAKGSFLPSLGSVDPYYSNVRLLMYGNGANNGTVFIEEKAHTLTQIGSTVTSTTQSKFGGSSLSFDGASALSTSAADLALGSGDFTIEFWIYQTVRSSTSSVFNVSAGSGLTGLIVQITPAGTINLTTANAGFGTGTAVVPLNQWTHIAVSRNSGTMRSYVDGVLDLNFANSTNFTDTTCMLGQSSGGGQFLTGFMDDIRITFGLGRYASAFVAPTAPFPNIGPYDPQYNLRTLIAHFDGPTGSTTLVDNGPLNKTITAQGAAVLSVAEPKYGANLILTGNNDRAMIAASTDFSPGTGDFAIEMWVYPTENVDNGVVCATNSVGGGQASTYWFEYSHTRGFALIADSATYTQAAAYANNAWAHIMVQRVSGQLSFWLNGIMQGSPQAVGNDMNANSAFAIGGLNNTSNAQAFRGRIDDFRFTKGAGRTTAAFTPPSSQYPDTVADPYFSNVTLLLPLDVTPFTDIKGHTINNFNTVVTTVGAKFDGAAVFNGVDTVLQSPSDVALSMGAGDFTQEAWVKVGAYPGSQSIIWTNAPSSGTGFGNTTIGLNLQAAGNVRVQSTYSVFLTGTNAIPLNTWTHLAISRQGTTMRLFINGVLEVSGTVSNDFSDVTPFLIGKEAHNTTNTGATLNGQIEELRVTKGVSRYNANFSVPVAPFPTV